MFEWNKIEGKCNCLFQIFTVNTDISKTWQYWKCLEKKVDSRKGMLEMIAILFNDKMFSQQDPIFLVKRSTLNSSDCGRIMVVIMNLLLFYLPPMSFPYITKSKVKIKRTKILYTF